MYIMKMNLVRLNQPSNCYDNCLITLLSSVHEKFEVRTGPNKRIFQLTRTAVRTGERGPA